MEVFQTDNYYIFVKRERSFWWNRLTSECSVKSGWDLSSVDDIECLGITEGIIGIVQLSGVFDPHIIIIKESVPVGVLYPPYLVYKIKSICILGQDEPDCSLQQCPKHTSRNNTTPSHRPKIFENNHLMNKTWGAVKSAGTTIKNTTQQAATLASNQVKSTVGIKDPLRIGKKICEEFHKIFDDTDSFYYCLEQDITNNLQRSKETAYDDRFFWNKHMIESIINLNEKTWILPIIQGFVQIEQCVIGNDCFTLSLISRRSRHRAGTRYKRRGVDEHGYCANYVETEQLLSFRHHQMAFTQVRGSVPVYWSQPGYKYRPPPRLDKDENETQIAFEKHFACELELYKSVCIINLVEQGGKEKIIADAYARHVMRYNSEKIIYVSFDFHDYCRGMRFENVSALVEALGPEAGAMGFHWRDGKGVICNQKSVFRVNCMDCLDRTNVVQTAIGKAILESQLVKLGLSPPYSPIPEELKSPFMILWANNGDIISRQYAGTNALKGDYTRTGERKLTGIMKDGMNSANRYFIQIFADSFRQCVIDIMQGKLTDLTEICDKDPLDIIIEVTQNALVPTTSAPLHGYFHVGVFGYEIRLVEELIYNTSYYLARFKDSYRQATIDLMLGNQVTSESLNVLGGQPAPDETDALEGAEHAKLLVEDCRRLLLGSAQLPVGAWGLIDADPSTGDPNETEVDSILLLTDDCYILAEYDSHLDKIIRFEKVLLKNITMIELGTIQQTKIFQGSSPQFLCLRLNYAVDGISGYFHMLRSPNLRFFNNVAVVIKTQDEITESLTAIVEFFRIALENCGKNDVQFICGGVLQKRKSRTVLLDIPKGLPRNLSESHLGQITSKALSNVAGQFTKLGQTFNPHKNIRSNIKANNSPTPENQIEQALEAEKVFSGNVKNYNRNPVSIFDSNDNDSNIFEPNEEKCDVKDCVYNENSFLPSVGIVMAKNNEKDVTQNSHIEEKVTKLSEDVLTMSISSVTDYITMPAGLLENASPLHLRAHPPDIKIDSSTMEGRQTSSAEETRSSSPKDFTLNLSNSQSDNALKQLKTLTSPLTKFAKGVQSFGMNLDPRKIATKSTAAIAVDYSPQDRYKLEEEWEASKCKTKLIAL